MSNNTSRRTPALIGRGVCQVDYPGTLDIGLPNGKRLNERSPIYLDRMEGKKAKYKIIIMAMKMEEETVAIK